MLPRSMSALRRGLLLASISLGISSVAHSQAAPSHVVTMSDMSYGSIPGDLKVGDTITWINRDTVAHTVTARDRSFDLHVNPGKSASLTLSKAGTIAFYCALHSMMRGSLKVAAK